MLNIYKYLIVIVMISLISGTAETRDLKVKGEPVIKWQSPLDGDIENNAYNRCRLIKALKPGVGKSSDSMRNNYDVFSEYISNLYTQSIKISAAIEKELKEEKNKKSQDKTENERVLLNQDVTPYLADIAQRMNIIVSFEAGTAVLNRLEAIRGLPQNVYSEIATIKDGKWVYVNDCEELKK